MALKENRKLKKWYFIRLAFLAILWERRHDECPNGTLFKQYYLVRAKNIRSAFGKANHILSASEHCDGDGVLNGKRVIFKKIGILDVVPLYEKLEDGVELFDESELDVEYSNIKKKTISPRKKSQMIVSEKRMGKIKLLDVYWGKDFEKL